MVGDRACAWGGGSVGQAELLEERARPVGFGETSVPNVRWPKVRPPEFGFLNLEEAGRLMKGAAASLADANQSKSCPAGGVRPV